MSKRPYDQQTEQPYLTGIPEFYDDKSELKEEIIEQNRRWEEAGQKARMAIESGNTEDEDPTAKTLLDALVNEYRETFSKFLADARREVDAVVEQTISHSDRKVSTPMTSPSHDLLDRWFKRFDAHRYEIEHTSDQSEINRLRSAMYNDAIATLFDIGLEMSKLISAVEHH